MIKKNKKTGRQRKRGVNDQERMRKAEQRKNKKRERKKTHHSQQYHRACTATYTERRAGQTPGHSGTSPHGVSEFQRNSRHRHRAKRARQAETIRLRQPHAQ